MKRLAALLLPALLVVGCSSVEEIATNVLPPSEARPPQALNDFRPEIRVRTLWQQETGSRSHEPHLRLTPAIDGNTLFVAGGNTVSAWDKTTGKPRWQKHLNTTISGGISTGEGAVYFGTSGGTAVALDQRSGEMRWNSPLHSEILAISPAQSGRVVFRTSDGRLHGLSAHSGESFWRKTRSGKALALRGAGTPILVGSMVVAGFDSGVVTAFDLQSGNALWEATLAIPSGNGEFGAMTDVDGKLSAVGEALFAASYNGQIAGINMRSGIMVWSAPYSSSTGVTADNSGVYTSNAAGNVWRLEPRTGSPQWKLDALVGRSPTAPALAGNYVVIGDNEGYLHWVNRTTGQLAARTRGDSAGYTAAALQDGNVTYTLGRGGLLSAFVVE